MNNGLVVTTVRRNEPCPCGSGRRYKDCHGSLASPSADAAALASLEQQALRLHQQGRIEDAERGYREILARAPGNAIATHYLGLIAWGRGELARAEELLRQSLAAEDRIAELHNNLGLLLRDTGRFAEALAAYDKALAVDPAWFQAHSNRALALEDLHRLDEAEQAYRAALAFDPQFAAAQQNLARLLLLTGRFAEGWERYRWRLLAQGTTAEPPAREQPPLPASLEGRRFALLGEQGLGDVLFFLRHAPGLARRGAQLAFRGDARLAPLLEPTGVFPLGCGPETLPAPGMETMFVGDLAWLSGQGEILPPALPLGVLPTWGADWLERLAALEDAPVIALTWRAGVAPNGPARTQLKEIDLEALGGALRGLRANWISIQRHPHPGERERLAQALGASVHDFSAANEDLTAMLALLGAIDHYVGPSNANTHLLAGLGGHQHVLCTEPPEWRWMASGDRSPWFPGMPVYRPDAAGRWDHALATLRAALAAALAATAGEAT